MPRSTARTGRPASDRRTQLDGIFRVLCTGAPWRELPERFGPWQAVYDHFRKWRKAGVFAAVTDALEVKLDKAGLIDWGLWCVDGASVGRPAPPPELVKKLQVGQPAVPRGRTREPRVGPRPRWVWVEVPCSY